MNSIPESVIIAAIFAAVAVVALFLFHKVRITMKGVGKTTLEVDASNPPNSLAPAIRGEGLVSGQGSVVIEENTNGGVEVKEVHGATGIRITTNPRPPKV